MYTLIWSAHFTRSARRFTKIHPELKKRVAATLRDLEENPFQPHLKLHPLKGQLKGLYSASITYEYRLTLTLKITEQEVILLDIGSHDEVY